MVLINISEDIAKQKKNIAKYNFLYLMAIACYCCLSKMVVGLTAALVAIPAATSRNLSKNLFQFSLFGLIFGVLSAFGNFTFKVTGLVLSFNC